MILALQADGHLVQMVADEQLPRFTRVETPVLETGLRYDGGDVGETGLGFDVGVGLRLDATVVGLMVDARGHASLSNWARDRSKRPCCATGALAG